jgi:hypothetical protein
MSGQLPQTVEQAAQRAAVQAWANNARAIVAANRKGRRTTESLPGRTWSAMSPQVRTALVMLTLDTTGDPRAIARQPWESFADGDRAALAATARQFGDECKHARCLF